MNENLPIERTTPPEYHSKTWFGKLWNHWLNPFGNWIEPLPYPAGRAKEAESSIWPAGVYWTIFRNPLHNFMTHWIGIAPIGPRYAWITPFSAGWTSNNENGSNWTWWSKPNRISLPFYNRFGPTWQFYIGWTLRGNFGVAFRKVK